MWVVTDEVNCKRALLIQDVNQLARSQLQVAENLSVA